jgi:hypothetical protein
MAREYPNDAHYKTAVAVVGCADMYRKDGFTVRDFDQDRLVADVQKELRQP